MKNLSQENSKSLKNVRLLRLNNVRLLRLNNIDLTLALALPLPLDKLRYHLSSEITLSRLSKNSECPDSATNQSGHHSIHFWLKELQNRKLEPLFPSFCFWCLAESRVYPLGREHFVAAANVIQTRRTGPIIFDESPQRDKSRERIIESQWIQ